MTAATIRANVRAILAARHRGRGFRSQWVIPGFGNGVRYVASGKSGFAIGAAVQWPARDHDGSEIRRGACLVRHRGMIKNELAKAMESCK